MSVRSYRVGLRSAVGTLSTTVLADWYDSAEAKALEWANAHPDHGKHGPWEALLGQTEVC